jgi:hypothetical protein
MLIVVQILRETVNQVTARKTAVKPTCVCVLRPTERRGLGASVSYGAIYIWFISEILQSVDIVVAINCRSAGALVII